MPKATKATIRARIEDVARVICEGALPFQILRFVKDAEAAGEMPWTVPEGGKGLCRRTIQTYVNAADKLLAEENRQHRKRRRRRHLAKLQNLYARCVGKGDERTARAVLHDLAEMQGLLVDDEPRGMTPAECEEFVGAVLQAVTENVRDAAALTGIQRSMRRIQEQRAARAPGANGRCHPPRPAR
jgi:hypothetical protein